MSGRSSSSPKSITVSTGSVGEPGFERPEDGPGEQSFAVDARQQGLVGDGEIPEQQVAVAAEGFGSARDDRVRSQSQRLLTERGRGGVVDEQQRIAQKLVDQLRQNGYDVATEVTQADEFWPAEEYHQNCIARHPERSCHARVNRFERRA